ncbi:MAG: hypothetical protein EAZ91_23150 [Cytophagales bacterium]|nr:MAG: hypothetical protein EAZ91_23150 [Cytophagales bacterium]
MKVTIALFGLVALLSVGAFANPRLSNKSKAKAAPARTTSVEQQLSANITYPDALLGAAHNSVVVVQYAVNNNRVSNVQVQTANGDLNKELTRQLTGLKVNIAGAEPNQVYTARLRFQL